MKSKSVIVIAASASVLICAGIGIGALLFNGTSREATPFVKQSKPFTGDGSLTKQTAEVTDSYNYSKAAK